MHVERVRFDRVFDAAHRRGDFSYVSGGRTVFGAVLPTKAIPNDGDTLVMVFAKPGDWSTLLGYRDPRSGRIWLKNRAGWAALAQLEATFWIGSFGFAAGMTFGGAAAVLAAGAAAALAFAAFGRKNARVRALLHSDPDRACAR